jgi:hypothetical protein
MNVVRAELRGRTDDRAATHYDLTSMRNENPRLLRRHARETVTICGGQPGKGCTRSRREQRGPKHLMRTERSALRCDDSRVSHLPSPGRRAPADCRFSQQSNCIGSSRDSPLALQQSVELTPGNRIEGFAHRPMVGQARQRCGPSR